MRPTARLVASGTASLFMVALLGLTPSAAAAPPNSVIRGIKAADHQGCLTQQPWNNIVALAYCYKYSAPPESYDWYVYRVAIPQGHPFKFRNLASGQCLDSNASGDVYPFPCNGGRYQMWWADRGRINYPGERTKLRNVATGRYLVTTVQASNYHLRTEPSGGVLWYSTR